MNTKHWIVITLGKLYVHFNVADGSGESVFSGSEPFKPDDGCELQRDSSPASVSDAQRAAVKATVAACRYAAHHGGIEGLEILG